MKSPTRNSLKYLTWLGFTTQVVEHYVQRPGRPFGFRRDLFGCIDIVALIPGTPGVLGVQTTSYGGRSARVKKILELPVPKLWLACGNRLEVQAWKKVGSRWAVCVTKIGLNGLGEITFAHLGKPVVPNYKRSSK